MFNSHMTTNCCVVAQWKVHTCDRHGNIRGENVVAFQNEQNKQNKGKWLHIKDNSTNCEVSCNPLVLLIT